MVAVPILKVIFLLSRYRNIQELGSLIRRDFEEEMLNEDYRIQVKI